MTKRYRKSKEAKGAAIYRWLPDLNSLVTGSQVRVEKKFDKYELKLIPFNKLKIGWTIQYDDQFWEVISLHTNNVLRIKNLAQNKIIKIELLEVNVRFLKKIGNISPDFMGDKPNSHHNFRHN